jgi:hypothetical protein
VADEVYRPLSENDDETPPPAVDFKIDSYTDFQKALKEHVGVSDHDVSAEEVADDITPRRQREEAPTPENASERPLVRMRSTKDSLSLPPMTSGFLALASWAKTYSPAATLRNR